VVVFASSTAPLPLLTYGGVLSAGFCFADCRYRSPPFFTSSSLLRAAPVEIRDYYLGLHELPFLMSLSSLEHVKYLLFVSSAAESDRPLPPPPPGLLTSYPAWWRDRCIRLPRSLHLLPSSLLD